MKSQPSCGHTLQLLVYLLPPYPQTLQVEPGNTKQEGEEYFMLYRALFNFSLCLV